MKNRLSFVSLLMAIFFFQTISAQENFKFGKISHEELSMNQYAPDTSATAVFLCMLSETKFTYNSTTGDFGTETDHMYRLKILKPEGKEYADITIPFYVSDKAEGIKEQVGSIKATAYTLADGKTKESELPKKYIFEEKSSGNWRVIKFSIPNVEKGSVIEYKYTVRSNDAYRLDTWSVQGSLPVQYARHEVQIPEFFQYKYHIKGYETIATEQQNTSQAFNVGVNTFGQANINCKSLIFTAKDIPSIKNEPFLWCIEDYLTSVEFELNGLNFPQGGYKSYANTWEMVKNTLRDYSDFGDMLKEENPFQEEMRTMQINQLPFDEKLRAIFGLLKQKIKWNGNYTLYAKNLKECIKQGSGSNAELNFILMAMLRDAGIQSKPILLRTRPQGRLPFWPTVDKLNTFVVAAYSFDGIPHYLDGSIEYGDVNILPSSLMVPQAIAFDEANPALFVDLSNIGKTTTAYNINVTIHPDGNFEGTRQASYSGQSASNFKRRMSNEKDSLDTMQKTEEKYNISIKQCKTHKTKGLGSKCNEQIDFSGEFLTNDDHIYLNPMIFPDETETPFTNTTRKFPVEFPYAQLVSINATLTIPEGYLVEELPQSARVTMNQNELTFNYIIRQKENKVTIQYRASINTPFIASEQYEELRSFWEEMVNRNNQQIVLKKAPVQP